VQLSEFTGQQHILGEGMLLRRMITADRLGSMIFYGPPGTGKTSLAEVIARSTRRRFEKINATTSGVKEIREIIEAAEERLSAGGARTILFIDELHRFSRSQQDVLLPHLEDGIVSLIGATTANPFFVLVPPLISRSQIFEFRELSATDLLSLLRRALQDRQNGLASREVAVDDEALQWIASQCDGDARRALTALEIAVLSVESTGRKVDS
ncbi:MAG: AAA family ATPase, partial [Planctomyces sp.]